MNFGVPAIESADANETKVEEPKAIENEPVVFKRFKKSVNTETKVEK